MANVHGLQYLIVPIDNETLKATPVPAAPVLPVFGVPSSPKQRVEVKSVGIGASGVLVIDTTACTINLVFRDSSANSETTLLTGAEGALGDLEAAGGIVLNEVQTIWQGSQSMEEGDTIRAPLTITSPTTPGDGYYFVVCYRIKEYLGE